MARHLPKPFVKKDDEVLILSGKDRGKRGPVHRVVIKEDRVRVVVGGINIVKRHIKSRPGVRQAGIVEKEAALHISNVMLICTQCGKPTRVSHGLSPTNKHVRVCKKCNQIIDRS